MADELDPRTIAGDLTLWYPAFAVYAASTTTENEAFHGPHVAPTVSLDQVEAALNKFVATYGDGIRNDPMLNVEVLRAELEKRRDALGQSAHKPGDEGSPWHNLWHWINGG